MNSDLKAQLLAGKTPGELGFVMPIETAPHAACWMAWGYDDSPETWGTDLPAVQDNLVRIASAISQFEKTRMIAHPDQAEQARAMLPPQIDVVPMIQDDLWFRDTGPLFVRHANGQVMASNLIFNNWGNKFPDYAGDAGIGAALARYLDAPLFNAPLTGEGGGLHSDGQGTVITTETCFLNPNRNPGMTKAEVEQALFHAIGARKVIWLPGDEDEWITDGHVDGLLTYTAPGKVIFEVTPDSQSPRYAVCQENLNALKGQTDARGNEIEIATINEAYLVEPVNDTMALSYVNAYIANAGVVIPSFSTPTDEPAADVFAKAFPDRRIVQVDMLAIAPGGGGIHCATQQQPG